MLNADSSAPKRPIDDQSSTTNPTTPMVAQLERMAFTARTIVSTELSGNNRDSSCTKYADSSPRPESDSSEIVRNVSGTKASRA
jgi:hypothetical protein